MIGFGWLARLWKEWNEAPKKIEALKVENRKKLDDLHTAIRDEKISDSQLNAVSVCLEAATIKLRPTGRVKGGGK